MDNLHVYTKSPAYTALQAGSRHQNIDIEERSEFETTPPEKPTQVQSWPRPTRLRQFTFLKSLCFVLDLTLTLLPLGFVILAILSRRLHNEPQSNFGDNVLEAVTSYGPTIFPYMFAGLVGRLMSALALHRIERGSGVAFLDLLLHCQSMAGTVEAILGLHEFTFIGAAIILLWCLSPLGGQSARRILVLGSIPENSAANLHYFAFNQTTAANTWNDFHNPISALFLSALMGSDSWSTPRDTWGNVKIPVLESLDKPDRNGWYSLNPSANATYSSLLGVPLNGMPSNAAMEFVMQSGYFILKCPQLVNISMNDVSDAARRRQLFSGLRYHHYNSGLVANDQSNGGYQYNSWFLDTHTNNTSGDESIPSAKFPPTVFFASQGPNSTYVVAADCNITYTRVEAKIICDGPLCAATTVRRSKSDHTPDSRTPLDQDLPRAVETFTNMVKVFPDTTPKLYENSNSATEAYLNGSTMVFSQDNSFDSQKGQMMDLSKTSADVFSQRFTTIFNTMWHSTHSAQYRPTLAPQFQVGAIQGSNYANGPLGDNSSNLVTTASVTHRFTGYIANPIWVSFLLMTSIILQICAIIGIFLKYYCFAPDILGYVSSMTRNNEFTPLPAGGSALDGVERSRLLRDYKVKLVDVRPEADVGKIALCSTDDSLAEGEVRLGQGRVYE